MDALDRANEVRLARSDLKHELHDRQLSLAEALVDSRAASMPVLQLLCAQWQWGRERTVPVLRELRIGELKPVGELTDRQCGLLVEACEPERKVA
jgi:hypothetical protein